ncbi:MAG: putative peptide zinc metalloprotease protein [Pseudonocardiales bacterium]|nr:putative peptide zinc metalloprotease protein [Pseudonocardiales bacterium]
MAGGFGGAGPPAAYTGGDAMTINTVPPAAERWCRTAGTRDLGEVQQSGLRDPSYLLRRGDGQIVQVSHLLYLVAREVSADRDTRQVASAVSDAYGRDLTVEGLRTLLTKKLEPIGLVQNLDPAPTVRRNSLPRSDPLLALRFRRTLVPARAVQASARVMAPVFRAEVVVGAVAALVVVDVVQVRRASLSSALGQVLATPSFVLAVLGLLSLGALVHELGHAAACAYGGAQPGVIGFGIYLVFPAFFTNVTDSYRLGRAGRIRTDLGGLYLNVWCLLALGGAYLTTGQGVFLLTALLMHLEMLQQLVPTVRFDGYFLLSDIAGVPDLFARMRPVLRHLIPGRTADPELRELRPAARRIVVGWVLVVAPLLVGAFGWLLYSLPVLVHRTADAIARQVSLISIAWRLHDVPALGLAVVSIVFLAVPLLGIAVLLQQMAVRLLRRAVPHVAVGRRDEPTRETSMSETPISGDLTAAALTDEVILGPPGGPRSDSVWRRAVHRATAGAISPGPTSDERRRATLLARVTAPIKGSRRVVVMSRKGGVGKTTITLALGSTYATLRGDRVVAVDANPDAGNLAHRVSRPCARTITDLLDEMQLVSSYADLRDYTAQAPESRLEVLASNDDPRIGSALDRNAYQRVIELLDHYYNLILLDTGTGILDSANQGLLAEADQLVVVLRPALDGARAAALTLDWLSEHGYGELVARAVVVINGVRRRTSVPIDPVDDHFARRCAHVVNVPWDRALEAGARTSLTALAPATRSALTEVAAAVADNFTAQTYVRTTDRERVTT